MYDVFNLYLLGIELIGTVSRHVLGETVRCEAAVYGGLDHLFQRAFGVHTELA